ncbi:MAG: MFS transporter [Planctomycetes bacterium]|nr:MFS transporter [Planctomycetota bacterium]
MPDETQPPLAAHDPYAALRSRDFRFYTAGNFLGVLGMQMQSVAIGWEIYDRTGSTLRLGLVGLVQIVPVVALAPLTGHVADRLDRRRIVMTALTVIALAALGLAWISGHRSNPGLMYACLFVTGVARAFQQPSRASLLPLIVPARHFANAVTWNTGAFHLATVLGLLLGGPLIELTGGAAVVYLVHAGAAVGYFAFLSQIGGRPPVPAETGTGLKDFAAGFAFLWRNQIIFGAITLDLLAVLLGGSTGLLPVYAKDLLKVGPTALSCMHATPAAGAFLMSIFLGHRPPFQRSGRALLWGVTGFGVATILFGLSRSFWTSLVLLFLMGAFDNVSVVIRHTLVQVLTPNELRGRVSAVNGLFIGASNDLGNFESNMVAEFFGPTISVVSGGVGTLLIVVLAALVWPQLRGYGRLGSSVAATGEQGRPDQPTDDIGHVAL